MFKAITYLFPYLLYLSFLTSIKAQTRIVFSKIDSICVVKAKRQLYVFYQKKFLETINIGLGKIPIGAKQFKHDGKTPEGLYRIVEKNEHSPYNKSLLISYPSPSDVLYAKQYHKSAGGNICLHGMPESCANEGERLTMPDWTLGCIALRDADINRLFPMIELGCKVCILP
jgi:murein L,D-transpeptidase YafK